jgi:hypothetical protein
MHMRRLTRLTNGFSKKLENLRAVYALHFAYYNFCRIHKTLRCTPAMAAEVTGHVWELRDLLGWSEIARQAAGAALGIRSVGSTLGARRQRL